MPHCRVHRSIVRQCAFACAFSSRCSGGSSLDIPNIGTASLSGERAYALASCRACRNPFCRLNRNAFSRSCGTFRERSGQWIEERPCRRIGTEMDARRCAAACERPGDHGERSESHRFCKERGVLAPPLQCSLARKSRGP